MRDLTHVPLIAQHDLSHAQSRTKNISILYKIKRMEQN